MMEHISSLDDTIRALQLKNKDLQSELDKQESKLSRKEWYFSAMVHELRQPLLALNESSQQALRRINCQTEKEQKLVRNMADNGEILLCIVNNILDVQKLQYSKISPMLEKTNIREVTYMIVNSLASRANQKQLELCCSVEVEVPQILLLDKTRYMQVLMNLISNSIKFTRQGFVKVAISWIKDAQSIPRDKQDVTPQKFFKTSFNRHLEGYKNSNKEESENEQKKSLDFQKEPRSTELMPRYIKFGQLDRSQTDKNEFPAKTILPKNLLKLQSLCLDETQMNRESELLISYTHETKGTLMISIKDSGKGINPDNIPLLFNPFKQENEAISKTYGGTGLGLWMSKEILTVMDGEIHVASCPGLGSKFSLSIPADVPDQDELSTSFIRAKRQISPLACFVVDEDTQQLQRMLHKLVENSKYFDSAQEMLEDYENEPTVDCVFLANDFSDENTLDGMEIVKELRLIQKEKEKETNSGHFLYIIVLLNDQRQVSHYKTLHSDSGVDQFQTRDQSLTSLADSLQQISYSKHQYLRQFTTNIRALVVDDEPFQVMMVGDMLKDLGIEVIVAYDGEEALEIAFNSKLDLIILDLEMPSIDGKQVIQAIRKQEWVKRAEMAVPIVLCSGNDGINFGMADVCCVKPIDQKFLEATLKRLGIFG